MAESVQTHPIHVTDGRRRVLEVRSLLFAFPEVLEVFVTGRRDLLVVVCSGHPRPARWLAALRASGYRVPVRRLLAEEPNRARIEGFCRDHVLRVVDAYVASAD